MEKLELDMYKEIEMSDERSGRLWCSKLKNKKKRMKRFKEILTSFG